MSMSMTSTLTSWWGRNRNQILKGFSQMLRKMLILMSIKVNRLRWWWGRKSKRIISSNDHWRRRRNIEIQRRNQRRNRPVRRSMPLWAVQSPVQSFKLLSCGARALRGIRGSLGP